MSQIILDFGSGNSCLNDKKIVKRMYDELKAIDSGKHKVIAKWQIFKKAGDNIPLDRDVFDYAYKYGNELGYQVTSSVFDKESLDFLLQFDVPFIKIANNRSLDYLIGEIPRKIPVYVSYGSHKEIEDMDYLGKDSKMLFCVSDYPATIEQYEKTELKRRLGYDFYISDHTTNFGLWYRYQPEIIEMHYKLSDSQGLDAGSFARTPKQLAEIL